MLHPDHALHNLLDYLLYLTTRVTTTQERCTYVHMYILQKMRKIEIRRLSKKKQNKAG